MEAVTRVRPAGCSFTMLVPARHREVYEGAGYESYSTVLFQASCTTSDVVVDIGAHMGYYSLLARQANADVSVVAVEASPENHEVLGRNLGSAGGAGGSVRTVNAAFGATRGTVTIQLTEASDNCGIFGHPVSPTLATVDVPAVTGADLDVPAGSRMTVKLDVEGNEVQALDGLEPVLAACPDHRLFIELNPKCLDRAGASPEQLLSWLFHHGYRIFLLDESEHRWSELRTPGSWSDHLTPLGYANIYCVPAARALTVGAVLHYAGTAGAERSHVELVEELVARGALVHTVLPMPDAAGLGDDLVRAGSSVGRVGAYPWWAGPAAAVAGEDAAWRAGIADAAVVEALRAVRPDVVLTQTGVVPQGAVAAAVLGIPHVWFLREFGDLDHGYDLPLPARQLGAVMRSLSAAVLTNSAAVRDHFFGAGATGVTVAHPFPRLRSGAAAPRPADRRPTVGVVGSLNPGKGHEDVLEALAVLRAEGMDVPLVAAGQGDPADQVRLRDAAQRLGVADLLTLTGPVRDRDELYAMVDVVAMPSHAEAFGRVPFEATAAGLPVVYRESSGPAEYMTPGVTGLAYRPGQIGELAAALRSLVEDEGLRARLVAAAHEQLRDPARREQSAAAVLETLVAAAATSVDGPATVVVGWLGAAVGLAASHRDDLEGQLAESVRYSQSLVAHLDAAREETETALRAGAELRAALAVAQADAAARDAELRTALDTARAEEAGRVASEARLTALSAEHAAVLGTKLWRWAAVPRRVYRSLVLRRR